MVVITGPNGEEVVIDSHGPKFKAAAEFVEEFKKYGYHCLPGYECEGLPPHRICWEDNNSTIHWED